MATFVHGTTKYLIIILTAAIAAVGLYELTRGHVEAAGLCALGVVAGIFLKHWSRWDG
jgi:hypothetical protein